MTNEKILACNSSLLVRFQLNDQASTWLIDTGATISAVKYDFIVNQNIPIHKKKTIINGIGGSVQSIGYVYLQLSANGETLRHPFHVFHSLPCRSDGILGNDFLMDHSAVIDYDSQVLKMRSENNSIALPLLRTDMEASLHIPRRSETIHYVMTNASEDCLICTDEIREGIFIASMLVKPSNGKIPIRVLNTTDEDVIIDKIKPTMQGLNDYEVFSFEGRTNNASRVKSLFSELSLNHLNKEEKISIENICAKYADIFQLPGDKLTTTNLGSQTLHLKPNSDSVYVKPYRLPYAHKSEINNQVNKMLEDDIIEPARSEWSSPILLVPKKVDNSGQKKWRLVIDYRKLNDRIQDDKFPLPNISEILDSLSGAIYYTHLDLFSGYYQVELDENSRKYTAFCSDQGQFQMKRLPMGLKTSPNVFSRMITLAMSGLTYDKCFVYLDDLIVFGRNLSDHNKNIISIFERLRQVNLKLNPHKCEFLRKEILYLGHVVSGEGILPDPAKIEIVKQYPVPKNTDEVKRFVAFANYYRKFIPNFAEKAYELNKLCRKNQEFNWNKNCESSFKSLKDSLISPPVLQYPDFSETNEFQLQTDASGYSLGAILSNGDAKPIAYTSRSLNKAELNYPTIQKELLAIVWAVKHFRPYLYGRTFTIFTDHRPLIYLFNMKDPSSRLMKFRMALEEYDFVVKYVKGSDNAAADALSRISSTDLKEMNAKVVNVMTRAQVRKLKSNSGDTPVDMGSNYNCWPDQPKVVEIHKKPRESLELTFIATDKLDSLRRNKLILKENETLSYVPSEKSIYINPSSQSHRTRADFVRELQEFCKNVNVEELFIIKNKENNVFVEKLARQIMITKEWTGPRLCVLRDIKKIIDKDDKKVILNDFHLLPTSGHAGIRRMFNNIRKYYFWIGMENDIRNFVRKCTQCQTQKYSIPIKEPMVITPTARTAFEKVFLDIVGPLSKDSHSYSYILTLQCDLSKYVEAYPLISKGTEEVARAFVTNFVLRYGIPKYFVSDRGTEFMSSTMEKVCCILNINKLNSTAYHHQTIGSLENTHKHLGAYLRIQTDNHPETWSEWLQFWSFSHNTSVHSETGFTPFELVFGKKCNLPSNLTKPDIDPLYNSSDYALELRYRLQVAQKEARESLIKKKCNRKITYDKNCNAKVYKPNDLILIKNEDRKKLDCIYKGPFVVIRDLAPNVEILNNGKLELVHKNRTKLYYPSIAV